MSREAFHNLLQRYTENKCTPEERKIVEQWYEMLDDRDLDNISDDEFATINFRFQSKFDEAVLSEKRRSLSTSNWFAIAASLIGILVTAGFLIKLPAAKPFSTELAIMSNVIVKNTTDKPMPVTLPDKSIVTLQPTSMLEYPAHFSGNTREVVLTGEAFFEVSKDKNHPFMVYSENLITQVLGTSFNIKVNANHTSEVVVRTGKVRVTKNTDGRAIIPGLISTESEVVLTPNQKAVLHDSKGLFIISLVDNPVPVREEEVPSHVIRLEFNESSLSEVFDALSKTYGIPVVFDDGAVRSCRFTGDLTNVSLITQLDLICKSSDLRYSIKETTIYIEGKGCK